jgi:protein-disulfide isomerase
MKWKSESWLTATLVACALLTTSLVVRRELFPQSRVQSALQKPTFIKDWKSELSAGVRLGPENAPVQLIEFADFECPYCATLHTTVKVIRERYPTQVALTYVHFPLRGHRFAMPAARVAECAGDQGRFDAMYDRLFDEQESFGLKAWSDYAIEAGVPDLVSFEACVQKTSVVTRIEQGKQLVARLDVKATPTLIVNGWMLARPPTVDELNAMVGAILAGRSPVSGRT